MLIYDQRAVQSRCCSGFLLRTGREISRRSVGNVVDPFNLADQYGVDQMRYFFLREVPFGQDGNSDREAMVARIDADLADDLSDPAQRSAVDDIAKQVGGVSRSPGELTDNDKAIGWRRPNGIAMLETLRTAMATQHIASMAERGGVVRGCRSQPRSPGEATWALAKTVGAAENRGVRDG